jgi:hypothetical protein
LDALDPFHRQRVAIVTVELFVGTDPDNRAWEPDYVHEAEAALRVAGKVWRALHASRERFLLAFNLHQPNVDLLVVSERGLGVVEMKSHRGKISLGEGDEWLAAGRPMVGHHITPGKDRPAPSYSNPHAQVQMHGARLFDKTIPILKPLYPALSRGKRRALRLQTNVCFTNPDADLSEMLARMPEWCNGRLQSWESDFAITTPEELPAWISALRFEVKSLDVPPYYPFRLNPTDLENILRALHPVERWLAAERMLPAVRYGSLVRMQDGLAIAKHMLWEEETRIGRDTVRCTVVVPGSCARVSRQHATIRRVGMRVLLHDAGSNNGTFVNGERVTDEADLPDDARITLGGPGASEKDCAFVFRRIEQAEDTCDTTEDATRPTV